LLDSVGVLTGVTRRCVRADQSRTVLQVALTRGYGEVRAWHALNHEGAPRSLAADHLAEYAGSPGGSVLTPAALPVSPTPTERVRRSPGYAVRRQVSVPGGSGVLARRSSARCSDTT